MDGWGPSNFKDSSSASSARCPTFELLLLASIGPCSVPMGRFYFVDIQTPGVSFLQTCFMLPGCWSKVVGANIYMRASLVELSSHYLSPCNDLWRTGRTFRTASFFSHRPVHWISFIHSFPGGFSFFCNDFPFGNLEYSTTFCRPVEG